MVVGRSDAGQEALSDLILRSSRLSRDSGCTAFAPLGPDLTAANHSVQDDEAYDYDANGNRDGSQTHLGSTSTSTVIANNRISSDGIHNYTYDDEGNLLTKTKISNGDKEEYTWDHRNRLTKVTFKNSGGTVLNTVEYEYDYLNRMLSRKETPYSGGTPGTATTDYFVHDGMQIVLQFQKVGAGSANLTERYLWGPGSDQLLVDEKVTSTSSAGTNHWALTNHVGSVVDVATYDTGIDVTTIVKHRRIDAFGNVTFDSATGVIMVFAFTGKYRDAATGWSQHWWRWLVTPLGIWASHDPKGLEPDTNPQRYVENEPITLTDPDGLEAVGHHWVPVAVILENAAELTAEAIEYAAGASSGGTDPTHCNATYGGVKHTRYNEIVSQELKDFRKMKGRKLTAEDMEEFAAKIEAGKDHRGRPNKELAAFNNGIRSKIKPGAARPKETLAQVRARGRAYMKRSSRFLDSAVGALVFGAAAALIDEHLKAAEDTGKNPHFQRGVCALNAGDLLQANKEMVGNDESLYSDLVAAGHGTAALNFKTAWLAAVEDARQKAVELEQKMPK